MTSKVQFSARAIAAKLRGFVSGVQQDAEFDEELQEHLQLLTERFIAQGLSPEEAARAARLRFGNTTLLHEDRRELQTLTSLEALWLDLRYSLRTLWKSRAFTTVSIATLGLGIGAATAIFSVVDNVLLAPFPYRDASRIVFPRVLGAQQSEGEGRQGYTAAEAMEFAERNQVFSATIATGDDLFLLKHGEGTEQLYGVRVTPGTFEFFGMPPLLGRVMQPSDYEPEAPPVFVMRYKTWKERFNADPSILNKTFLMNGTARTLIGIMPPRFGWFEADVLIPGKLTAAAAGPASQAGWFFVGRLKPGVSTQQAQADLTLIMKRLAKIYPQSYPADFNVQIRKIGDTVIGNFSTTLYIVLAAVGLLLLIACSNVANLMLARATTREKEFAMRTALGAGRARLVRLLMVESLVLAISGAVLGTFVAWGGLKLLVAVMPQDLIPTESIIELNTPVLVFTLCIAVLTALIFGLAPSWQASRHDLNDSLRDSGKGVSGNFRGKWLRDALVVAEVALSLILLIGAGLLMRSFVALRTVQLGLKADHVFETVIALPSERYKTAEQVTGFFRPLLARLKALPGVVDAAASSARPPYSYIESKVEISGESHQENWLTLFQQVSDDYFRTLRIELKKGRTFTEQEVFEARRMTVVNETFVRKYLPNEDAIGRHLRLADLENSADPREDASFEIIGVVANVTNRGLQVPIGPEVWVPYTTAASAHQVLIVRTAQEPATMADTIQKEVWATDSGAALAYPSTLEDRIAQSMYAGPRFGSFLMTIFGCIGLILVTVGIYSVLAYSTARKTQEIGIRMALGAKRGDVLEMVVWTGLRLVAIGAVIGIALSFLLGRVIGSELVGVRAYDPATLAATTFLLTLTAGIASCVPAWKAARVDPVVALRFE